MRKKIYALCAVLAAGCVFSGCVPTKGVSFEANPDFIASEGYNIDFVQLHNDAIESLMSVEDGQPYAYITAIDIDGNNDDKKVVISATGVEGIQEEDGIAFASAALRMVSDAAAMQDVKFKASSPSDFGDFYNTYAIEMNVVDETTGEQVYSLNVPAGGEIPITPDYETYVEDWKHELSVYLENAVVYGADGKVASEE
ncbi:MAG: hypothetical protein Q4E57_00355 [Eubacteriales bacterium]|nr:hypothetical protein [Eubacteriales bacterium]